MTGMLVDWTDARKLVVLADKAGSSWDEAGKKEKEIVNGDVALDVAEGCLERVLTSGCSSKWTSNRYSLIFFSTSY